MISRQEKFLIRALPIVLTLNIFQVFLPGEFIGRSNDHLLDSGDLISSKSFEHYASAFPELYNATSNQFLDQVAQTQEVKVLVLQKLNTSIMPYLSYPPKKTFVFASNEREFESLLTDNEFDFVIVTNVTEEDSHNLQKFSYLAISQNEFVSLYALESNLTLEDLDKVITWENRYGSEGVFGKSSPSVVTLSSPEPVDSAWVSNALYFDQDILLKVTVKYENSRKGVCGGHLSILGKGVLVRFCTNSERVQSTFVQIPKNESLRLALGLGGWSLGSGYIELSKVQVVKFDFRESISK
jgi:hypothetical protein